MSLVARIPSTFKVEQGSIHYQIRATKGTSKELVRIYVGMLPNVWPASRARTRVMSPGIIEESICQHGDPFDDCIDKADSKLLEEQIEREIKLRKLCPANKHELTKRIAEGTMKRTTRVRPPNITLKGEKSYYITSATVKGSTKID